MGANPLESDHWKSNLGVMLAVAGSAMAVVLSWWPISAVSCCWDYRFAG